MFTQPAVVNRFGFDKLTIVAEAPLKQEAGLFGIGGTDPAILIG
nr:hypothetical protein [Methylomarinum sp. Ch1-1]MDP4519664.1 hypothetical protein [Methylomarinum sp. Ch1-1]